MAIAARMARAAETARPGVPESGAVWRSARSAAVEASAARGHVTRTQAAFRTCRYAPTLAARVRQAPTAVHSAALAACVRASNVSPTVEHAPATTLAVAAI